MDTWYGCNITKSTPFRGSLEALAVSVLSLALVSLVARLNSYYSDSNWLIFLPSATIMLAGIFL